MRFEGCRNDLYIVAKAQPASYRAGQLSTLLPIVLPLLETEPFMEFDLFTILPLAAAVFVFWKLRSVLGSRDGATPPPMPRADQMPQGDNVVPLPGMEGQQDQALQNEEAIAEAIKRHADGDKALKKGLTAIRARDAAFDPDTFVDGARMAYEMIVTAFADGDKAALKGLLAEDVYENFAAAIDERMERGESVRSTFVGIENAAISEAEMAGDEAQVTVSFTSQIISATLDKDEEVIEGDLQDVAEVTDIWAFARDVTTGNPNWKLLATDA